MKTILKLVIVIFVILIASVGWYLISPLLFDNEVIAVGKAILSSQMISDLDNGVAVKVRDSLKSHKGELSS